MRSTLSREPQRSGGFSLLEIIVAIAILGVGVVTAMQLFSGSLRTSWRNENYSKAMVYARSLMEEAYTKEQIGEVDGIFDLGDGFEAERTARVVSSDEGATLYEITVAVRWPPGGSTSLKSQMVLYEGIEE